jgi:general secretion pathway protein N
MLGIGAYLAFVVASLPAGTAYRWLAPSGLQLAGVRGTLWSGQAATGAVAGVSAHDIHWQIAPWALPLGRLRGALELRLTDGFANTNFSVSFGRINLSDLRASTSLGSFGTLLAPVAGVQGQASLALESLHFDDGWPTDASGELRLAQLAVPPLIPMGGTTLIPLGDYRLSFTPTSGQGLIAAVADLGGPLEVTGTAKLLPDHSYLLEGLVRARPEADPLLVQGLEIMSSEADASGRRTFSLPGSL